MDSLLDTLSGILERIKLVPFFFFLVMTQTHTEVHTLLCKLFLVRRASLAPREAYSVSL